MTNKSNSHLARYAVVSKYIGQFAWFVDKEDAIEFVESVSSWNADPNYYSIEEVD